MDAIESDFQLKGKWWGGSVACLVSGPSQHTVRFSPIPSLFTPDFSINNPNLRSNNGCYGARFSIFSLFENGGVEVSLS